MTDQVPDPHVAPPAPAADLSKLPRVTRAGFLRVRAGDRLHDLTDGREYVVRAAGTRTVEATDARFEVFDLAYRPTFVLLPPHRGVVLPHPDPIADEAYA